MASAVTAPLERQFGQVPGLNQMTSTSSDGSSIIILQFALNLNIDVAEQEVQAAINAAQTYLPADLPSPPIYSKTNPADTPDSDARADFEHDSALAGRGSGRHAARAKNFAAARRWAGQHQRRTEARGARSGESDGAFVLRHQPGRRAHGAAADQPESGQGQFRRPAAGLPDSTPTISC